MSHLMSWAAGKHVCCEATGEGCLETQDWIQKATEAQMLSFLLSLLWRNEESRFPYLLSLHIIIIIAYFLSATRIKTSVGWCVVCEYVFVL